MRGAVHKESRRNAGSFTVCGMSGIDLCLLQSGPSLAGWLVSSSLPSILTVSIGMLEYIALIIAIAQLSCFGPSMLDCSFGFCSE